MKCPKCESEIKETARFCDFCGHHLSVRQAPKDEIEQEEVKTETSYVTPSIRLAPFYLRVIHGTIDFFSVFILIFWTNDYFLWINGDLTDPSKIENLSFNIQIFIPLFLYWFLQEIFIGRTLGKIITRTKIISFNGTSPTKKQTLIRTFIICFCLQFNLIELLALSFLVGYFMNKKALGLHDLISKTIIIKDE